LPIIRSVRLRFYSIWYPAKMDIQKVM